MDWLRLWHDMPNDPKWRTIARVSAQPIALVQAMYVHLLVDASRNVTRGHVTVTKEDIASALDVTEDQVEAVFQAMQGRVMDGEQLTGWEGRQPKREDVGNPETGAKSAAQRKRDQRERLKKKAEELDGHDASRGVTLGHDREEEIREDLKQTPPPTRADEFDSRTKFAMTEHWQPDEKTFAAVLTMNGLAGQVFDQDQFLEFKSFWIASPDDHRTQAKWEHALAQHLKRGMRNDQASGRTGNATQQPVSRNAQDHQGRSAQGGHQRPAQTGPLSAPDRVRAAIAERDAIAAVAGPAVGQDG
ncbi:DnaT-like ssDNA-binding domain-containing protein [Pseudomonas chlororaphis]|uniref:DnaT-like ssDNA-binding domain-containing protein n=1 Tax=Pseudomonas chlororaphis TaxID=587753 RepID=UPI00215A3F58|nr:DnaT-like ssDNA-binding domain-containing protein [Pseudomonas chlororaphis]